MPAPKVTRSPALASAPAPDAEFLGNFRVGQHVIAVSLCLEGGAYFVSGLRGPIAPQIDPASRRSPDSMVRLLDLLAKIQ
jgi:hypothetical protein